MNLPATNEWRATVERRLQQLRFDLSVKEYIESKRMLKSHASHFYLESAVGHRTLAQSCLTYLQYYSASSNKTSTKQDLVMFPLLEYAARSRYYHDTLQCDREVDREVSFLQSGAARKNWLRVHNVEELWQKPFETSSNNSGSALYYASLFGLGAVLDVLVNKGVDVNAQGGLYGNALQAASQKGRTEIVQLMLDKDADVNAQGGYNGNALQAGSLEGHKEVVQLLQAASAREF